MQPFHCIKRTHTHTYTFVKANGRYQTMSATEKNLRGFTNSTKKIIVDTRVGNKNKKRNDRRRWLQRSKMCSTWNNYVWLLQLLLDRREINDLPVDDKIDKVQADAPLGMRQKYCRLFEFFIRYFIIRRKSSCSPFIVHSRSRHFFLVAEFGSRMYVVCHRAKRKMEENQVKNLLMTSWF